MCYLRSTGFLFDLNTLNIYYLLKLFLYRHSNTKIDSQEDKKEKKKEGENKLS